MVSCTQSMDHMLVNASELVDQVAVAGSQWAIVGRDGPLHLLFWGMLGVPHFYIPDSSPRAPEGVM